MKNKTQNWVVVIAVVVVSFFVGLGIGMKNNKINTSNQEEYDNDVFMEESYAFESLIRVGTIVELENTTNLISELEYYLDYNPVIDPIVTVEAGPDLFEGLINGEYDVIITLQDIDENELEGYEKFLFGITNSEELEMIYLYVLKDKVYDPAINCYLQYFYSQPYAFLNNDEVYALESNIYEEVLAYLQ